MKKRGLRVLLVVTLFAIVARTQNPGAPTVDRVGFPDDYQTKFKLWYVYDRFDTRQVRTIYANDIAATVNEHTQGNYPYGSVLVMETWRALQDPSGPILDENGRFQKDPAAAPTIFVMRKERGFGEAYGPNRNGEWEYVAYRPDGSYQTRPEATASCAVCHLQATQSLDWVYRSGLAFFNGGQGPVTDAVMHNYKFIPGTMRVKKGSKITFYNADEVEHTITDDAANSYDSGRLRGGKSVTLPLEFEGEFNFHCSIHPAMRGKIIVEP